MAPVRMPVWSPTLASLTPIPPPAVGLVMHTIPVPVPGSGSPLLIPVADARIPLAPVSGTTGWGHLYPNMTPAAITRSTHTSLPLPGTPGAKSVGPFHNQRAMAPTLMILGPPLMPVADTTVHG